MIIMPDDHQPKPVERLLDWEHKYRNYKAGEQQLRNEPPQPNQERLNDTQH